MKGGGKFEISTSSAGAEIRILKEFGGKRRKYSVLGTTAGEAAIKAIRDPDLAKFLAPKNEKQNRNSIAGIARLSTQA